MSDDVAAVLAEALYGESYDPRDLCDEWKRDDAKRTLDALTVAGYAVVRVPEGVEVAHGARLVPRMTKDPWRDPCPTLPLYAIEAMP